VVAAAGEAVVAGGAMRGKVVEMVVKVGVTGSVVARKGMRVGQEGVAKRQVMRR